MTYDAGPAKCGIGPHKTEHLRPAIDALAAEKLSLDESRRRLRAMAIEHAVPAVDLISYFLLITDGHYTVRCSTCSATVPIWEMAVKQCLDCAMAEYDKDIAMQAAISSLDGW